MRISTEALSAHVDVLRGLDGVENDSLSGDAVVEWLAAGGRAVQSLNAIMAALTARAAALSTGEDRTSRLARLKGFPDVGALVSEVAQVPRGEAGRLVTLGGAMTDADASSLVPLTVGSVSAPDAELSLFGYLTQEMGRGFSAEKAAIIRRTLADMSGATVEIERSLVERARDRSVSQVRAMCLREFARVDAAGYMARMRAQRSERYVKFWDTDNGMVKFHGCLDAVTAIPLRTWVEDEVRKGLRNQRDLHPSERLEAGALAADALSELATHRLGCQGDASGVKSTIVMTVTAEDMRSGTGLAMCHGYAGPINVELLSQVAVDAQTMPALMGSEGLPLYLGRSKRLFSPAQRLAIAIRDGGCAKCGAPVARCDVHHIRFWSEGGESNIDNGVLLCSGCHHRLHDFGWEIEVIAGEVWFIPPVAVDPGRHRIPACATALKTDRLQA